MAQIINFAAYKAKRHVGNILEIERLEKEIVRQELLLRTGTHYMERERAAIKCLELKMQIVAIRNNMGIVS